MKTRITLHIRKAIYLTLGAIDRLLGRNSGVVIYTYHSVSDDGWRFSISAKELENQIIALKKRMQPISLSEVYGFVAKGADLPQNAFVITFDDGYADVLNAKTLLKKEKVTACVFVLSDREKADRESVKTNRPFLTNKDLLSLVDNGWEVGCHSATHARLSTRDSEVLKKEIIEARRHLHQDLHIKVPYFAYPHGEYSSKARRAVQEAGFKLAVSMNDEKLSSDSALYTLPRVGVDSTHSVSEVLVLGSPSVIAFRKWARRALRKYNISI